MDDEDIKEEFNVQADNKSVAIGKISAGGNIGNIAIGNTGYTVDEVSVLISQITSTFQPKPFDGRCPYKGLDVFEEEDAELFFGREKLVEDLVNRVKESRTVFITGPSGSGKSSLVRAGLIHALKQGAIKSLHSERWLYETMKPGRDPIGELGRVASSLAGSTNAEDEIHTKAMMDATIFARWCEIALKEGRDKRVVLFIDQFEEVFTQINNETERVAFLNLLTHVATVENGRAIVLFSMRSDFVSNCATYPQINGLLNQQFVQIGAMQPDELVSAIAQPALRVGLRIDPDLIAQIISDMKGEPGALPLMQFALKDLFDAGQAKGGIIALTLGDYLAREGIRKMLARHADDAFAKLSESEQELARSIFSGLIEIGRGTQDVTRRTALFNELIPASEKAEDVEAIVQKLATARLITTDEQAGKHTVTISHEKLIDAWPWLKILVNENRDAIALQNEIASDAKEWEDQERDPSYLYTGVRLANAREQFDAKKLVLNDLDQTFVDASVEVEQAEHRQEEARRQKELGDALKLADAEAHRAESEKQRAEEQTRSATKLRQRALYLTVALATVLITVGIAIFFGVQSRRQVNIAFARQLTAQAIKLGEVEEQPDLALLLSMEAIRISENMPPGIRFDARESLVKIQERDPRLRLFLRGHTGQVNSIVFIQDGTLVSGSSDMTIRLWDVRSGQPIGQPILHFSEVLTLALTQDSQILASGTADGNIWLWDVSDINNVRNISQPITEHAGAVNSLAFSPDGNILVSGSADKTVRLWDMRDVKNVHSIDQPINAPDQPIYSVAFSPDKQTFAAGTADGNIWLWEVRDGKTVSSLKQIQVIDRPIYSLAFSPDGQRLAYGGWGFTIELLDVATGQPTTASILDQSHSNFIRSVAFSPDGQRLASGSNDGTARLWNAADAQNIGQPLTSHDPSHVAVSSVVFSPNNQLLASGNSDGTIQLWGVTKPSIGDPLSNQSLDFIQSVTFSLDGKFLASGSRDATVQLWDMKTHQPYGQPLTGHQLPVTGVAFSPDGKTLASSSEDQTICLWKLTVRLPPCQSLTGSDGAVRSIAFSPNGKLLASGSTDKTIRLWEISNGTNEILSILQPSTLTGEVSSVAFSSNSQTLAASRTDGTVWLWDVSNIHNVQLIGQPLTHTSDVLSVVFNPVGKMLASGTNDGKVWLWDLTSNPPTNRILTGHSSLVRSVTFSPDGAILASGGDDHLIRLWDVVTGKPIGKPLVGHVGRVNSLAFSPDGFTLASGGGEPDGTMAIRLWPVSIEAWQERACHLANRNLTRAEWEQYLPGDQSYPSKQEDAICPNLPLEPEVTATP